MLKETINKVYPISSKSVSEIEDNIELIELEKGQIFIYLDSQNDKEYFVLDGVCRSFLLNPEGDELTISFFTSNSVLSPQITRMNKNKSILNFQSLTASKLATIDADIFRNLMSKNTEIRDFANAVLRFELFKKIDKEIGFASYKAKKRLIEFRKDYPLLENQIPHSSIASYLGISNISLSRLRKDLLG